MDVLFSFPTLVLAVAISAMLGRGWTTRWSPSRWSMSLSSAALPRPRYGRAGARAVGGDRPRAGSGRVIVRHILPNVLAPLIVQASVVLAFAILMEASLSYVCLGPVVSPGTMLNEGERIFETRWMSIFRIGDHVAVSGVQPRPRFRRHVLPKPPGRREVARSSSRYGSVGVRADRSCRGARSKDWAAMGEMQTRCSWRSHRGSIMARPKCCVSRSWKADVLISGAVRDPSSRVRLEDL